MSFDYLSIKLKGSPEEEDENEKPATTKDNYVNGDSNNNHNGNNNNTNNDNNDYASISKVNQIIQ